MSFETTIGTASCALIGAGLLTYGLYQRSRMQASQSWQQVPATITEAGIVADTGPDSSGYYLSVAYNYVVDGIPYTGKRIGFSRKNYVRKKRAQAELDRYPVNSTAPVYFDPQKPADAVLVRDYPDSLILIIGGGGLLGLAAVIVLWGA